MATHYFALGERVCLKVSSSLEPSASFEVTALLPKQDGVVQYKIKSENELSERIVREDEIQSFHEERPANNNIPAHLRR